MSVRKLFDLGGRVALVTGGSRGLGMQVAEALGEMGARVAITARKPAELEEAREHLAQMGIESLPIACDMSDRATIPAPTRSYCEAVCIRFTIAAVNVCTKPAPPVKRFTAAIVNLIQTASQ